MKNMNQLTDQKSKAILATKKAQGTINKVVRMIESDLYCPDIIQQIDTTIGLLKSTRKTLLLGHLNHCVEHKIKENKQKTVEELIKIYSLT